MLKRKIDTFFEKWKDRDHKPVLLEGARQTGKTTSIIQFGRQYDTFLMLNFIEDPSAASIFSLNLDAETIETSILVHLQKETPQGSVLLLLDEIQMCPRAIEALKFMALDSKWDVIATGSEQGLQEGHPQISWPVGFIEYKKMNGLDFEEFLWAMGTPDSSVQIIRKHLKERTPIPAAIHQAFMQFVHRYLIVGGMPEVVQIFADTRDFQQVFNKQRELLDGYMNDIARFASADIKQKAQLCYKSITAQLDKPNHKFQYNAVEKNGRARTFDNSVNWLETSRMSTIVCNISAVEYPVQAFCDTGDFRLYPTEIGMLMSMYGDDLKYALLQDREPEAVPVPLLRTAKGGIYECLAADMLYKAGYEKLVFFKKTNRQMEIEFVLDGPAGPVPVEIKAGRARSRSLDQLLADRPEIHGFKFGSFNIGISNNKTTMPIYLLPFIKEMLEVQRQTVDDLDFHI